MDYKQRSRNQLDKIFAQVPKFQGDYADLKNASLENADISKIMEFYEDQLKKKELDELNTLLESKELKD